jgi:hypothetical protein
MGAPFRSLPPPLLSSRCHCGYEQMPLRLRADATAATSRCHCGYNQMPLRLQADATAATSRCHCGYKQMPLRLRADATAATSRCHCSYEQMPLRLHKLNKITDRPNIRHQSCPTSSHTLFFAPQNDSVRCPPCCAAFSAPACSLCPPSIASILSYAESYAETYAASSNRTHRRQLPQGRHQRPVRGLSRRRLQMPHPQRLLPDNVCHGPRSSHSSAPLAESRSSLRSSLRSSIAPMLNPTSNPLQR